MAYLSLASIVAEANRSANDAQRLLDLSFQPLNMPAPEAEVKQEKAAVPAEDNSGEAATVLGGILDKFLGRKSK